MTLARLGLKVKVMGQGHVISGTIARRGVRRGEVARPAAAVESGAYGRSNAVGLTSILYRGQFIFIFIDQTCIKNKQIQ